jgi:hypothetical protein
MAFSRGPYARQDGLPAPRRTQLVSSQAIEFATKAPQRDSYGNPKPMRDTANRVMLTLAYEVPEIGKFVDARSLDRHRQRVEKALQFLVDEGAISGLRVTVTERGTGRPSARVTYFDELRSKHRTLTLGPKWSDRTWAASSPSSDGTISLTSWLSYECATADTYAQTSATTVKSGFAANAFRGWSQDGSTWYGLVEPERTNLVTSWDFLNDWTEVGTPNPTLVTGPDGESTGVELEDDDGGTNEYLYLKDSFPALGEHTLSVWARLPNTFSGSDIAAQTRESGSSTFAVVEHDGNDTWHPLSDYSNNAPSLSDAEIYFLPAGATSSSNVGIARYAFPQVEAAAYPTSPILGTRATSFFKALTSDVAPWGYFDLTLKAASLYAHDEVTGEHDWIYIDADNRVYYDGSDDSFHFVLHGVEVATVGALTFDRYGELTVQAKHLPDGVTLTVSGATTGDDTATADAVDPLAPAEVIYLFGDDSGTQEGVAAASVTSTAHAA